MRFSLLPFTLVTQPNTTDEFFCFFFPENKKCSALIANSNNILVHSKKNCSKLKNLFFIVPQKIEKCQKKKMGLFLIFFSNISCGESFPTTRNIAEKIQKWSRFFFFGIFQFLGRQFKKTNFKWVPISVNSQKTRKTPSISSSSAALGLQSGFST